MENQVFCFLKWRSCCCVFFLFTEHLKFGKFINSVFPLHLHPPSNIEFFSFPPPKGVQVFSDISFCGNVLIAFGFSYTRTFLLNCCGSIWNILTLPHLTQSPLSVLLIPSLFQDLAYQWRIRSFNTAYSCKAPFHSSSQLDWWTSHTAPQRLVSVCGRGRSAELINIWKWQRHA